MCEWMFSNNVNSNKSKPNKRPFFCFQFIEDEEQGYFGATKTVKLEEIGYVDRLPCPERNKEQSENLCCVVDTEGTTSKHTLMICSF